MPAEATTRAPHEERRTEAEVFGIAPAKQPEVEEDIDVHSVFANLKGLKVKED